MVWQAPSTQSRSAAHQTDEKEKVGTSTLPPAHPASQGQSDQDDRTATQKSEAWTGGPVTWPVSLWPWTHPSPL